MTDQPPPPEGPDDAASSGESTPPTPPPPAPSPYGQPAPGYHQAPPPADPLNGPYSATTAIGYGWNQFIKNPGQVMVPAVVYFVVVAVVAVLAELLLFIPLTRTTSKVNADGTLSVSGGSFFLSLLAAGLLSFIIAAVAMLLQAGIIKAALGVTDGKKVSLGEAYAGWDKGKVIVAALLIGLMVGIGSLLCYLPGIILAYLSMFTMYFVIDKGMSPVDAIKASFSLTTSRLGETLVFAILAYLVTFAGALLCGVGLIASVPIATIATAYTYRRLHGEPVAPVPQ